MLFYLRSVVLTITYTDWHCRCDVLCIVRGWECWGLAWLKIGIGHLVGTLFVVASSCLQNSVTAALGLLLSAESLIEIV